MPAIANRQIFTERVAPGFKPSVDPEAGIIRNVKFLGNESENGRRYGLKVRRESIGLYENCRVFLNHPSNSRNLERRVQDWVGRLENVRAEPDGNYGDLRLRTKHPEYPGLIEAAQGFWQGFGLSHVASGDSCRVDGVEIVTEIFEVFSVDLVVEPASVANLFESRRRPAVRQADDAGLGELARRITALERQADADRELADIAYGFEARAEQARARLAARRRR